MNVELQGIANVVKGIKIKPTSSKAISKLPPLRNPKSKKKPSSVAMKSTVKAGNPPKAVAANKGAKPGAKQGTKRAKAFSDETSKYAPPKAPAVDLSEFDKPLK